VAQRSGFAGDPEFQQAVQNLIRNHIAGVAYTPVTAGPEQKPVLTDREPSIVPMPLLHKAAGPAPRVQGTLFALVRGVLHALDPVTGELRWACRVGVDTTLLPVRLPAGPAAPAVAILTSSDHNTIWAVEETSGTTIWEQRMDGPCLAQPVLVAGADGFAGNRLLVPGYSGRVEERRISDGLLLGFYELGQPLTVGGVHQAGTGFVYFPGENYCVYVLDVTKRSCAAVLYSGHPRGALRSAPVVITEPGAGPEGRGILVLSQEAENDDAVKLRAFALPITNPDQAPAAPELKAPGWSWFPPYQDGERLALATDAGIFALYGVGQKGNRDPLFFPMLKDEVTLDSTRRTRFGRAQIVHADAENFWVLAHGRLQRLQLTFTRQAGPKVIDRSPDPLQLGSPLHEAQVLRGESGETFLFLVTRVGGGQTCLASMVAADSGRLVWQRQLGIGGHGPPLTIGNDILIDDRNGVFRFDAGKFTNRPWQAAEEALASFPQKAGKRFAFAAENDKAAYVLHFAGTSLKVLHYQPGEQKATVKDYTLPRPLAGTPCLGVDCLVLPLDNGVLERLPLGEGPAIHGPTWRAAGAEEGALGHVGALGGNRFAYTDGGRGLKIWSEVADIKPRELPRRIIAPPAVVPGGAARNNKIRLCVADADDTLTLLDSDNLTVVRTWRMPGKISAGPFVRGTRIGGTRIGCVVAGDRLVWLDPDREQPLWEYRFDTDIVGQPHVVKDMVVVANLAGHIMSLDPATGRPLGAGYMLRANVAPAAAPLPFAANRLFVPLTDGTIMLLPQKLLQ
jgi:outer membrane protein assembly factor BamB